MLESQRKIQNTSNAELSIMATGVVTSHRPKVFLTDWSLWTFLVLYFSVFTTKLVVCVKGFSFCYTSALLRGELPLDLRVTKPFYSFLSSMAFSDNIKTTSETVATKLYSSTSPSPSSSSSLDKDNIHATVLGGGNFGLALSSLLARKNINTTLLVRSDDIASQINANHVHPTYMPDLSLPSNIRATAKPAEAFTMDTGYVVHAVPVQYSRSFLTQNKINDYIPPNVPVLSASKGIESTSLGFMFDILQETLGTERQYAFLSGPSFAREVRLGLATAVVIASHDLTLAEDLAVLLSCDNFRVFTSRDVIGVEIGGAVKNVIALAAGMCEGLGLGTNAMSALVTRGCGEMRRLGIALGAKPSTIAGLSGELTLIIAARDTGIIIAGSLTRLPITSHLCGCRLEQKQALAIRLVHVLDLCPAIANSDIA